MARVAQNRRENDARPARASRGKTVEHRQVPYDLDMEAARVLAAVLKSGEHPHAAHEKWLLEKAAVGLVHPHAGDGRPGRVVVQLSVQERQAVMRAIDEPSGEEHGRIADRITSAIAEAKRNQN